MGVEYLVDRHDLKSMCPVLTSQLQPVCAGVTDNIGDIYAYDLCSLSQFSSSGSLAVAKAKHLSAAP